MPLLTHSKQHSANLPNGGSTYVTLTGANGVGYKNGAPSSSDAVSNSTFPGGALLELVNERLYAMVAECMAWLSDYEVFPDKSIDDTFKR
jgi:hypothetical protein